MAISAIYRQIGCRCNVQVLIFCDLLLIAEMSIEYYFVKSYMNSSSGSKSYANIYYDLKGYLNTYMNIFLYMPLKGVYTHIVSLISSQLTNALLHYQI